MPAAAVELTRGGQIGGSVDGTSVGPPVLGVSLGDPLGIGPEVLVRALADPARRGSAGFIIFGAAGPMHRAAALVGVAPFWREMSPEEWGRASASEVRGGVVLVDSGFGRRDADLVRAADERPAGVDRGAGALSFRWVDDAIAAAQAGQVDAIVTGPISKESWALAGHGEFPGHTELLAARFGAERVRMMFIAPTLRVMLATTHLPLMRVREALTIERVYDTIGRAHEACRGLGISQPRIALCGLNPHAGEGGLLGDDEARVIDPALRRARESGWPAEGPFPGDTVWNAALAGRYDLVIAMYHDQGLIPVKLLAFHSAVNVSVGLPVWRTSPDHGTAFDIAGRGVADPGSMSAALDLAVRLARSGTTGRA